jgi:polar amino acid transport system substrate-binding protein
MILLALPSCTRGGSSGDKDLIERARERGVIRVGFANEPPYAFLDPETGELAGEAPAVARMVLDALGVERIEGVLVEFGALIPGLQAGRFDMIAAGMYITPDRCGAVAFTQPTYCVGEAFLVAEGNPLELHSYADLIAHSTARLGLVSGTVEVGYAEALGVPEDRIVMFPDMASAAAGVAAGRADAFAGTSLTVADLSERLGDTSGLEPADPFEQPVIDGESVLGCGAFAFRPGDTAVRDTFDAEIANVLGTPAHLEAIRPFGFGEATAVPQGVTRERLCGP